MEVPIYFFRFEDLLTKPKEILSEMFCFVLGIPSLEGTVMEARIDEIINGGTKENVLYKPRSGGMNKNKHNYTEN
jgi:hypothetical protein